MRTQVNQIIDPSKFNRFHFSLIFWCFLILVFDGYDVVIYGATVPLLIEEWSLSPVTAGAIGSYTVVGTALGAIIFGLAADKIGRKRIILLCTVMFSLFTCLSGLANGPVMFTICRVIAGMGLGGVMPNVIALAADYSPKSIRNAVIAFIFCGYSVGAILCSLLSKSLVLTVGWKPVYLLAGLPLFLIPLMIKMLPESTTSLLIKGKDEELKKLLGKANPEYRPSKGEVFEKGEVQQAGSPVMKLFENGRGFSTVMFWIGIFSSFVLIYAMNTWLPKLMVQAGYDLGSSLMFMVVMNVGAIFGAVTLGKLTDMWGFKKVLVPLYAVGALAISFLGFKGNIILLYGLIFIVGAATVGAQNIVNAFVSQYYPAYIRSTGLGVSMGFGRIGGIVAPILVGFLLSMNFPVQWNFLVISIAAVMAGIANALIQEKYAEYNKENQSIEVTKEEYGDSRKVM
ncbi:MFS transporter [Ammoniphilus sp. 3BR4]|uniref:MFS transporter n=1 Tax=Ammoniphilus sp. 3BR4 TaxID=3158265 RepID=UPI0034679B50